MVKFIDFLKQSILYQYRTPMNIADPSTHAETMVMSSIARTNLECDLAQRGGSLVQEPPLLDSDMPINPKSQFCFSTDYFFCLLYTSDAADE